MASATSRYLSPLRYPGGKGRLARFVAALIGAQRRPASRYVEPFAGGAGVGLRLLFDEHVDEIVLNDLNPGIAAFWRSLFFDTSALLAKLKSCRPSVAEWRRQHEIYKCERLDTLALGFATFFLNRTNRSGILDARPIGGFSQNGSWGIGARFDKETLGERMRVVARYASRVTICERDGIDLISDCVGNPDAFVYADPPYLVHGDDLYLDTLRWEDHERLARLLRRSDGWLLTYDADARVIDELYVGLRCAEFQTSHTAAVQHIGTEYAVFANDLTIPSLASLGSGDARFVVA